MDGAFGQNQYDIPKGITINEEDVPYDDNHEPNHEEVYFFKIPTNKEYGKNVSYTIKATSKEDDTCVKFYEVVLKTKASINICADSTEITAEEKKFFVNYTGVPETMIFRINVYQGSKDNLVQTYDCHGTGTVYYQADENTEEDELTFIVNAVSIDGKIKGKVCGGEEEDLIFTQGGYDPPEPPEPEESGITLSPSTQTIGKDNTSFTVNYEGIPSGLLFNIAVFDSEGNKVKDDQLCAGNGSISYTCGVNEEENDRTFTVSASTSDGVYTDTATVTQTHGEEPGPGENKFVWTDNNRDTLNLDNQEYTGTNDTKYYEVTGYSITNVVSDSDDWLTTSFVIEENKVIYSISENGGSARSGVITVYADSTPVGWINVQQNGAPTRTITIVIPSGNIDCVFEGKHTEQYNYSNMSVSFYFSTEIGGISNVFNGCAFTSWNFDDPQTVTGYVNGGSSVLSFSTNDEFRIDMGVSRNETYNYMEMNFSYDGETTSVVVASGNNEGTGGQIIVPAGTTDVELTLNIDSIWFTD